MTADEQMSEDLKLLALDVRGAALEKIFDWADDRGLKTHLLCALVDERCQVPMERVQRSSQGPAFIVLNLGAEACGSRQIDTTNRWITAQIRVNGQPRTVFVPFNCIAEVFLRDGQNDYAIESWPVFDGKTSAQQLPIEEAQDQQPPASDPAPAPAGETKRSRGHLRLVK